MALKSYRRLDTDSRFLKGVLLEAKTSNFRREEREEAEHAAATEIDSRLSTTFDAYAPDYPPVVRLLADLIGSATILEWLALTGDFGPEGAGARKPSYLLKKAEAIFEDLIAHRRGLLLADGGYHPLYPSPDVLPTIAAGEARPLTVHPGLAWGQMAQPQMSDAEKRAWDVNRGRRAFDDEAALAGAYGL